MSNKISGQMLPQSNLAQLGSFIFAWNLQSCTFDYVGVAMKTPTQDIPQNGMAAWRLSGSG